MIVSGSPIILSISGNHVRQGLKPGRTISTDDVIADLLALATSDDRQIDRSSPRQRTRAVSRALERMTTDTADVLSIAEICADLSVSLRTPGVGTAAGTRGFPVAGRVPITDRHRSRSAFGVLRLPEAMSTSAEPIQRTSSKGVERRPRVLRGERTARSPSQPNASSAGARTWFTLPFADRPRPPPLSQSVGWSGSVPRCRCRVRVRAP